MFGLIRKKELYRYIKGIKDRNRKENLYFDSGNVSLKTYSSGYEDGTDNMFNAICKHFKINRK